MLRKVWVFNAGFTYREAEACFYQLDVNCAAQQATLLGQDPV